MIYLDNAATSFPKPASVWQEMNRCIRYYCGNPGRSGHRFSLQTGMGVYRCRELLAEFIGAESGEQILFTSNATEALNLALKGILKEGDHVLTTAMEHNSVLRPLKAMERRGVLFDMVKCREDGSLDLNYLRRLLNEKTRLIAVTHASNVVGTVMPIKEIGTIAREAGALFLLDASQSLGSLKVNVKDCGADLIAGPGHKGLLGPQGTGFLYAGTHVVLSPLKEGGTGTESKELRQPAGRPEGLESGTVNGPGLIGLAEGIRFIHRVGREEIRHGEEEVTGYIDEGLRNMGPVTVYGPKEPSRKAAVTSFNIGGMGCEEAAEILNKRYGIAVRAGFHCAGYAHRSIGTWECGTVRVSPGPFTTKREAGQFLSAIYQMCKSREG